MSKCHMPTENHLRESEIWFKQKTMPNMNYEWIGKRFRKNSDPKNPKNKSEIATCEQKNP